MRSVLSSLLLAAFVTTSHAGGDPTERTSKPELERPAAGSKPVDGKTLCAYISPDQNAPSERQDCIADREPLPQRPTEKTPPGPPANDTVPSSR